MPPGIDVQELVLFVYGNAVRRVQSGFIAGQPANRKIFAAHMFVIDHNLGRKFDCREKLFLLFVDREVVDPMRSVEDALGRDIPLGIVGEDNHLVAGVRFH